MLTYYNSMFNSLRDNPQSGLKKCVIAPLGRQAS
jgi:hypothetical protein